MGIVKVLAVDDDPAVLAVIRAALLSKGAEILTANDSHSAWETVCRINPDIVLLDLLLPGVRGMELLEKIVDRNPAIDVVLLTGEYRTEYAVEAIRKGACDYLTKPVDIDFLAERVGRLILDAQKRLRGIELEDALVDASIHGEMVGRSPEMVNVFARLQRIAPHYRSALITGATGTGKELAARALHALSPVADGPFVVCNCASIVETLFESALFGHIKGSFTGADRDQTGLFEAAHQGTVFLDEIGEVPLAAQSKLLRVLQGHEIQRIGSSSVRKLDVRVIAATNRNLRDMIAENHFREDLYYRLAMVNVHLPRLIERKEDLPLLQRHFVNEFSQRFEKKIKGITRRAQMLLARHSWPGNVRELENAIGHACMMTASDMIDVRDLPEEIQNQHTPQLDGAPQGLATLAEVEKRHTQFVLESVGGNKQEAAEILGISRNTLYRILKDCPLVAEQP